VDNGLALSQYRNGSFDLSHASADFNKKLSAMILTMYPSQNGSIVT